MLIRGRGGSGCTRYSGGDCDVSGGESTYIKITSLVHSVCYKLYQISLRSRLVYSLTKL